MKRRFVAFLLMCLVFTQMVLLPVDAKAKKVSVSSLTKVVKKYTKSEYPFSSGDKMDKENSVFGVMSSKLSSYAAFEKIEGLGTDNTEYKLLIAKTKSKSVAKSCTSSLRRFLKKEKSSKASSLSANGRQLYAGAQIGSKGQWCWLIMVSPTSDVNETAAKAVKKAIK